VENQFLGNCRTHTLDLDAAFHNFAQGDLSVTEYCCKFKGMSNAPADLGLPVNDQILILNILCGLNQCFEHLWAIIRRSLLLPLLLKVRDDLLLEEIHLDTTVPSAAPTVLNTSNVPPAPKLQVPAPSHPPNNNNSRNKNNNRCNGGNGSSNNSRNGSSGGDRGGNSGNTTTASPRSTRTNKRATSSWPTYINPWQGHIAMYLEPVPTGQQRLQAYLAMPVAHTPSGFMPRQQRAAPVPSTGRTSSRLLTPSAPWRSNHLLS
jgi:hypothetical protein